MAYGMGFGRGSGRALAPFEPIDSSSEKFLALKMAFLLAITFLKRVADLQALSVASFHLDFATNGVKAFLGMCLKWQLM